MAYELAYLCYIFVLFDHYSNLRVGAAATASSTSLSL